MKFPLVLTASSLLVAQSTELRGSPELVVREAAAVSQTQSLDVSSTEITKPNILLLLVDDQGHGDIDLGDQEQAEFHTPALSQLASIGVKLSNFYSGATCTPSRAMLMTGRYTMRYGFQDSVIHATEPRGVPLTESFVSQKMKTAGYTTVMIGKWHLGMHTESYVPLSRGFDFHYGILTGGGSHTKHISVSGQVMARGQTDKHTFSGLNLWENGKFSIDNTGSIHSTELYTKKAMNTIQHLETTTSDPWFVFLSFQAIHDPIEVGNEDFITNTKCNAIDESLTNRRIMCGMMAEVDDGVKKIHEQLVSLKAWERTLIIYASDNGGLLDHGSSNAPYKGEKGMYYEGGIHVPAFLSGGFLTTRMAAKSIAPFALTNLAHITDLHTTMAVAAGYQVSKDSIHLDGLDLLAQIFEASTATTRSEVVVNVNSELFGNSGAIIMGDYKMMVNPDPQESTIYAQVKAKLQNEDTEVEAAQVAKIAAKEVENLLEKKRYIFNLAKNPTEIDLGDDCEVKEECANLAGMEAYAEVEKQLVARFEALKQASAPTTFAWEDDGAIANPMFFGNLWSPWRDINGDPRTLYQSAVTTAALVAAKLPSSPVSLAALREAPSNEIYTAVVGGAALLAVVATVAFKAGQKSAESKYDF